MSYSRWSNSSWYTFWSSTCESDAVEDQVLSLWYSLDQTKDWTWEEIRHWTVADILENYIHITEDEAIEAYKYIQQWLRDVEEEYHESKD